MTKYCTIYTQTIIPLFNYGDFLIEGGSKKCIDRLGIIHEKANGIIDYKKVINIEQ